MQRRGILESDAFRSVWDTTGKIIRNQGKTVALVNCDYSPVICKRFGADEWPMVLLFENGLVGPPHVT